MKFDSLHALFSATALAALTLGGCGGGGSSTPATSATTPSPPPASTPAPTPSPAAPSPAPSAPSPAPSAPSPTPGPTPSPAPSPAPGTSAPPLGASPPATAPATSTSLAALVNNTTLFNMPAFAVFPAKGSSVTDPRTGFVSTRVADKSELVGDFEKVQSGLSAIVYSRYTPSSSKGDYVLVHGNNSTSAWIYRVADNRMMTILRFNPALGQASRSLGELNELRWDYSGQHPYRLYFSGRSLPKAQGKGENVGMSFYYLDFDPATGTHAAPVLVRDFSADFPGLANAEIMNDVEGDSSNDSRYWAWQVMNTSVTKPYAVFSYDMGANTILGKLHRSCTGIPLPCRALDTPAETDTRYLTRPNMVEMSPLGTRVIVHFERAFAGNNQANTGTVADGPKGFLPDFSDPIRIGSGAQHSGWAWGTGGEERFIYQNSDNDWIEAVDIRNATTADCKVIAGNQYSCGMKLVRQDTLASDFSIGFHFGKIYDKNKRGYAYLSTYDTGLSLWGKNQELLIGLRDGSAAAGPYIVRLGSSYNRLVAGNYRTEGVGALSFDATSIWATANWGYTDGRGEVLRIQLPPNLFSLLPPAP